MKSAKAVRRAIRLLSKEAAREDLHPVDRNRASLWTEVLRWVMSEEDEEVSEILARIEAEQ